MKGCANAEGDRWQAVEIPYTGQELAMSVIVPERDGSPAELLAPEVLAQTSTSSRRSSSWG